VSNEFRKVLDGLQVVTPSPEETARQAERERAERRRRAAERGIPERCLWFLADGRAMWATKAVSEVTRFLEAPSSELWALVLAGPRGCGKTLAAAAACWERDGRFLDVARLARTSSYDDEAMSVLERTRLLAIDDLGTEYADAKGAFASRLDGLINARYAAARKTIVTTNCNLADFKARFGDRIADRLREGGRFFELSEASMRGRP
jgi:DNA replication protein DnaC